MKPRFSLVAGLAFAAALASCGGGGGDSTGDPTTTTTAADTTTTTGGTGSSTSESSEGGFIDTSSSSSAGGSSTGPACSDQDMCMSIGDCELGDCVDCMCVFDYGPCAGGKCTCFVPSVPICTEGGCFCTLPCIVDEPNPCPATASGTAAPVCAMQRFAGQCGLPCAGEGEPGCPDGMTCVARPMDQPEWGDFICVFP